MFVRATQSWFRRVAFAGAVLATAGFAIGGAPRPAAAQYYPGYGYGYGYGFGFTSLGFVGSHHHHGGRSFVFFGDPFFDPFYYSYIPPSIPYPTRTVTFANGRVVSFQYLVPPYR